MEQQACCPHDPELHDEFGCAAWRGYFTPGAIGRCPCTTPRAADRATTRLGKCISA